jgi:FAD/FMN-containing dehydrogenase
MTYGTLSRVLDGLEALTDPSDLEGVSVDWTGAYRTRPVALARPTNATEAALLLARASAAGIPVTPQGGNTSLVAGALASDGGIVCSSSRLGAIEEIEPIGSWALVESGVTLAALQEAARPLGLEPPVDLGSRGSATVGGLVATNAGGERVVRHGTTGRHVLGLELATCAHGVISRLPPFPKDNAGFEPYRLAIGSEGTVGFITRIRLRLERIPAARVTLLAPLPDLSAGLDALARLRSTGATLELAEWMTKESLSLVIAAFGLACPCAPGAAYLAVQVSAAELDADDLLGRIAPAVPDDAVVATQEAQAADLLRYREEIPLAIAQHGPVAKFDLSLPLPALPRFVHAAEATARSLADGAPVAAFGHLAEGGCHLNVVVPPERRDHLTAEIYSLTARHGGSIGAEHGIGRIKRPYLPLVRNAAEIALMRDVKRLLDPAGILNPEVLL